MVSLWVLEGIALIILLPLFVSFDFIFGDMVHLSNLYIFCLVYSDSSISIYISKLDL